MTDAEREELKVFINALCRKMTKPPVSRRQQKRNPGAATPGNIVPRR